MRTRDERRKFKSLKIRKARKVLSHIWGIKEQMTLDRLSHTHADNLKKCSCSSCGNPRKHFDEKTIQEKVFDSIPLDDENDD